MAPRLECIDSQTDTQTRRENARKDFLQKFAILTFVLKENPEFSSFALKGDCVNYASKKTVHLNIISI